MCAAAGALVALVGRNEGGKTLSRTAVNAVLDTFCDYLDPAHFRYTYPALHVLRSVQHIATVAIADANKKIMLQHDKLLDTLVAGLLLDDDRSRPGGAVRQGCGLDHLRDADGDGRPRRRPLVALAVPS